MHCFSGVSIFCTSNHKQNCEPTCYWQSDFKRAIQLPGNATAPACILGLATGMSGTGLPLPVTGKSATSSYGSPSSSSSSSYSEDEGGFCGFAAGRGGTGATTNALQQLKISILDVSLNYRGTFLFSDSKWFKPVYSYSQICYKCTSHLIIPFSIWFLIY